MDVLIVSPRGQITIPKKLRTMLNTNFLSCTLSKGSLILTPIQTKEEFFDELEASYTDWKKHGGKSLAVIKKEYEL